MDNDFKFLRAYINIIGDEVENNTHLRGLRYKTPKKNSKDQKYYIYALLCANPSQKGKEYYVDAEKYPDTAEIIEKEKRRMTKLVGDALEGTDIEIEVVCDSPISYLKSGDKHDSTYGRNVVLGTDKDFRSDSRFEFVKTSKGYEEVYYHDGYPDDGLIGIVDGKVGYYFEYSFYNPSSKSLTLE